MRIEPFSRSSLSSAAEMPCPAATRLPAKIAVTALLLIHRLQPGPDGPQGLLPQGALERGHQDPPVLGRAIAHLFGEDFVAFLVRREITQVWCEAAGNRADAVASSAV